MIKSSRGENWVTVISNSPTNDAVNECMAEVLGLVHFQQDKNSCLDSISKNPGLAMLLVDGFSDLAILHNLDCLPVNIFRTEPRLVALSGDGITACFHIDPNSAFSDLEFPTPAWRDLKNALGKEAIDILLPPEQVTSYYKGKQVLIVPPLVTVTILESNSLLPAVLIPALSSKIQEFDRWSATVKACMILRPVLKFLWAVHHKKVPPTVLGLDHSQDAKDWSSKLHLSCILPSLFQNRPPFCGTSSFR
jgi:hypothetical protein